MQKTTESNTVDYLSLILERNEREKFAFDKLNPIEQAKRQAQNFLHYAQNPWPFLRDCVYTLNQVSKEDYAVQPFPSYLDYLKFLCDLWQKEDLLAIPKSRRMVCSWSFISLYTHNTIFNEGRFNAFVSKKEEDAGELVSRAEFIYHKIPDWRIPRALLPKIKNGRMTKDPYVLEFDEIHSLIRAFPQGAHQMRQFTVSGILGDECAFWEQAQQFYSASKPTIDGGGRCTLISSRSPGFFKKIVYDKLDALDLNFKEVPPAEPKRPIEGVEVWKNPKNQFVVVDLHYTADPRKRGALWKQKAKASMPARDFAMEYEKSWSTFDEKPVFADFNRSLHCATEKVSIEPHLPILMAFSFGLTPSCLIAQLVGRTLRFHKEFQVEGSVQRLATTVWNYMSLEYPGWVSKDEKVYVWAHPEGFEKKDTDERSCVWTLKSAGFRRIRSGDSVWERSKTAVEEFLTRTYGEGAALQIGEDCPVLSESLGGGYRYKKTTMDEETQTNEPIRDRFARMAECAMFICSAVSGDKKMREITMQTPHYGFLA